MKAYRVNLLLAAGSVLLTLLAVAVVDWSVGRFSRDPRLLSGLLFPPHLEVVYDTFEFRHTAKINSLGIRDHEVPLKSEHAVRIAAIGDSFTFGWGVDLEDTWVKLVERGLRERGYDVEILNLGCPGFAPNSYANVAEWTLPLLEPDVVLVGLLQGNDLEQSAIADALPEEEAHAPGVLGAISRSLFPHLTSLALRERSRLIAKEERRTEWFWSMVDIRASWRTANVDRIRNMAPAIRKRFDAFEPELKRAFREGQINPVILKGFDKPGRVYDMGLLDINSEVIQSHIAAAAGPLGRLNGIAEQNSARVIGLSIPMADYYSRETRETLAALGRPGSEEELTTTVPDDAIAEVCHRVGVPCLRVMDTFRERVNSSEKRYFYPYDTHFTVEGNRLYAELLVPLLEKELFGAASREQG